MSDEPFAEDFAELGEEIWLSDDIQETWLTINHAKASLPEHYLAEEREYGCTHLEDLSDTELILLSIATRLNNIYSVMHKQAWIVQESATCRTAPAKAKRGRPRKEIDLEHVVAVYLQSKNEPGDTLANVAQHLAVSRATAGRYVAKAREANLFVEKPDA